MQRTVTMISSIIFDPKMYNVKARPLNRMWNRHAVGWDDLENWSAAGRADGVYDDCGEDVEDDDGAALLIMPERTLFV